MHKPAPLYACKCVTAGLTLALFLLAAAPRAGASTTEDNGFLLDATAAAWNQLPMCEGVPGCTALTTDWATVYTTDYGVAQVVLILGAQDQETWTWQAIEPDETIEDLGSMTYYAAGSPACPTCLADYGSPSCFVWGADYLCSPTSSAIAWGGPYVQGQQTGQWNLQVLDNENVAVSHSFILASPPLSWLEITSPGPLQLIDLAADQNWTATDPSCPSTPDISDYVTAACFSATASGGNPITWYVTLNYQTSTYDPNATPPVGTSITDPHPAFQTDAVGTPHNEVFSNEGGEVTATASTMAPDGSPISDSITFYVEGPIGGIPGPPTPTNPQDVITPLLDSLYQSSYSYKNDLAGDPNGGVPTSNLMTGIAWRESQYRQFTSPSDNPPNSDLYPPIDGKWPNENVQTTQVDRGTNIGLMQARTALYQITAPSGSTPDPNAWNWVTDATDGVAIFSNGSATVDDKVQDAVRYEGYIINGYQSGKVKIPAHVNGSTGKNMDGLDAVSRENNALVLYAGDIPSSCKDVSCSVQYLYYYPTCSGKTTTKGNVSTCSTTWQWTPNPNCLGIDYVAGVRGNLH
jgi:hypothetical protein